MFKGSIRPQTTDNSNPNRLTLPKYSEYQEEQPLYPHPLEDAKRAQDQDQREITKKNMAKQALLDQIEYNKIKRALEKQSDKAMGL